MRLEPTASSVEKYDGVAWVFFRLLRKLNNPLDAMKIRIHKDDRTHLMYWRCFPEGVCWFKSSILFFIFLSASSVLHAQSEQNENGFIYLEDDAVIFSADESFNRSLAQIKNITIEEKTVESDEEGSTVKILIATSASSVESQELHEAQAKPVTQPEKQEIIKETQSELKYLRNNPENIFTSSNRSNAHFSAIMSNGKVCTCSSASFPHFAENRTLFFQIGSAENKSESWLIASVLHSYNSRFTTRPPPVHT